MKKFLSITILFITLSISVFAQEELFKVLINKGKNTINHSKPLFTGSKIYKGQTINLSKGGYIGLIYKNGRSMELKVPGNYLADNLEKNAIASSGSISKKYADLVLSEMTKDPEGLTEERKKHMKVTGAVDRGDEKLNLITTNVSDLLGPDVPLTWNKSKYSDDLYAVHIFDMFDDTLKTLTTKDTTLSLLISDLNLKAPDKSFIVRIKSKKATSSGVIEGKMVKVLDSKDAEELRKELTQIKMEAKDSSATTQLILARFYEQHKLYLEAVHCHIQAIKTEPRVAGFKHAYENFLIRNQLLILNKK